jgi:hypothetical protein
VNYLLGGIIVALVALLAWQLWRNRDSALPAALEKLSVSRVENAQLIQNNAQLSLDKATLSKEVEAQKKRADLAEVERDRMVQAALPHLHGTDLVDVLNGVLRPEAGAGDRPGGTGDGDAPPPNVQPGRIPVG